MIVKKLSVILILMMAATVRAAEPIDIGSRLEPLVDNYLIDNLQGVSLTLHQAVPREVVMMHDQPWEGNVTTYHVVFQDGDLYRMYYRAGNYDLKTRKFSGGYESMCYAESKDGIHWTKPELGLYEFQGSKQNNIIQPGMLAVFKDANPACKPEQKYKAIGLVKGTKVERFTCVSGGLAMFQSPDGIHWSQPQTKAAITKGSFDSLNLAFWDAARQRYVAFYRDSHSEDKRRDIRTCTSTDLVQWTDPVWLEYPGAKKEHLYTNGIVAYERAPHIFLGFPMRFVANRSSETVSGAPRDVGATDGLTDGLFMTSRDGLNFHRWGEALIRPGLQSDCWVARNHMPAWGVVQTKSDTIDGVPELSLYAVEGYYQGNRCRLRRFTMRMDGFASVHAGVKTGEMLTKPLVFSGKALNINFSTNAAGLVRVEIQDAAGKPIPGFALADCPAIFGDRIEYTVAWKQGNDVSKLAGQPIRLRFVLKDADLYAIRFCAD